MRKKIFKKNIKILFSLLIIATMAVVCFLYFAMESMETKTYGNCEIAYYSPDFSEMEVDKVADALSQEGLFGTSQKVEVLLEREDLIYKIIVPVKTTDVDQETYQEFRDRLQKYFPENKIIFALSIGDTDNVVKMFD